MACLQVESQPQQSQSILCDIKRVYAQPPIELVDDPDESVPHDGIGSSYKGSRSRSRSRTPHFTTYVGDQKLNPFQQEVIRRLERIEKKMSEPYQEEIRHLEREAEECAEEYETEGNVGM